MNKEPSKEDNHGRVCTGCGGLMKPLVFMKYWQCEGCDIDIAFTKKEAEAAKQWIKNRRRRLKKLIAITLPIEQAKYRLSHTPN